MKNLMMTTIHINTTILAGAEQMLPNSAPTCSGDMLYLFK